MDSKLGQNDVVTYPCPVFTRLQCPDTLLRGGNCRAGCQTTSRGVYKSGGNKQTSSESSMYYSIQIDVNSCVYIYIYMYTYILCSPVSPFGSHMIPTPPHLGVGEGLATLRTIDDALAKTNGGLRWAQSRYGLRTMDA